MDKVVHILLINLAYFYSYIYKVTYLKFYDGQRSSSGLWIHVQMEYWGRDKHKQIQTTNTYVHTVTEVLLSALFSALRKKS